MLSVFVSKHLYKILRVNTESHWMLLSPNQSLTKVSGLGWFYHCYSFSFTFYLWPCLGIVLNFLLKWIYSTTGSSLASKSDVGWDGEIWALDVESHWCDHKWLKVLRIYCAWENTWSFVKLYSWPVPVTRERHHSGDSCEAPMPVTQKRYPH